MAELRVVKDNMNETDKRIYDWRLGGNLVLLYSDYDTRAELEEDYRLFMDMELEYQRKSNDESIRIFGKTNEERYHEMLHKFNVRPENELIEVDRPVVNDEDAIISPLDKLFLIRESAINRNYLDTINKSRYIKFIQEDASVYDIKHDKDIIKEEIDRKLYSDNIYDDVRITFPFLSLEAMRIDERLEPQTDEQEKWQKAYKKMMCTGDSRSYMNLASYWKDTIIDTYNRKKEAEKSGDTITVDKCNKILIGYGWAPDINPNNVSIDKASELTRDKIVNLLDKITMVDLTTEDIPQDHNKLTVSDPYLYIAAFKIGNKYTSIVLSSDKDFNNAIQVGYDFSSPNMLATPMARRFTVKAYNPNFKCEVYVIFNNGSIASDVLSKIYLTNSPDFDTFTDYNMDINNVGGLKLFLHNIFSRYNCVFDNDHVFMYKIHDGEIGEYLEEHGSKYMQLLTRLKLKYDKIGLTESTTNEFPIEFDKDGNLLINKGSNVDFDGEYSRTHLALKMYEESNNITGMKYCICKLWYLNIILEDKIHDKKTDSRTKDSCTRSRAKIMNDIKKYTPIIMKHDPSFDILKTYQNSPFNNDKIVIKSTTLFYIYKLIKRNFSFKDLKNIFK